MRLNEVLGRHVGDDVDALYQEILERWPSSAPNFVLDFTPSINNERGYHRRHDAAPSDICFAADADDEVIFHELLHEYFYRLGAPYFGVFVGAKGYQGLVDLVESVAGHPYLYAEMQKRGFDSTTNWKYMEEGILAWGDKPESTSAFDRMKNAAIVAEFLTCATIDPTPVHDHFAGKYPGLWALAGGIVEVIALPDAPTFESWRTAMLALLGIAQNELATEGKAPSPVTDVTVAAPVLTDTELRRPAHRVFTVGYVELPGLGKFAVLRSKRDGSLLRYLSDNRDADGAAEYVKSRLFLETGRFAAELAIPYFPATTLDF